MLILIFLKNYYIMVKLFEHQKKCIEFIKTHDGLILYNSMGSGKTVSSLKMAIQFPYPILIISTKASRKNFIDDINKLKLDNNDITIYTYQKVISEILNNGLLFDDYTVIVDEAHHLRSGTKLQTILIQQCMRAKKIILLTGTLFYNGLTDMSVLVNIVRREEILPESDREFKFFYYDDMYDVITNQDDLRDKIKDTISYYVKPIDSSHYPKYKIEYKQVDMNNEQISEYRHYVRKILSLDNIQHIDYSILDKRKLNNFLTVTRQLSNTVNNSPNSPKIQEIYKNIKDNKNLQIIVYSNFLENGLLPLSLLLTKDNIKYGIYYGGQTEEKRNKIVDDYNNGKINVLLISSAGSESLDLKNTRIIHIMEPHWNESKVNQIIGRTIRYDSHKTLPEEDRNVLIIIWLSVFGYKLPYETADEYLVKLALKKDKMFKQFDEFIKENSI